MNTPFRETLATVVGAVTIGMLIAVFPVLTMAGLTANPGPWLAGWILAIVATAEIGAGV